MTARKRVVAELGGAQERVMAWVREDELQDLRSRVRPAHQADHRKRMPGPVAIKRERGERRGPDRIRTGIGELGDGVGGVVKPRSLKVQEALDGPAVSPLRNRKPVRRDEQ